MSRNTARNNNDQETGSMIAPRLQHDYHDYSVVPDEALGTATELAIGSVQMANAQPSFPVKLHQMLESLEREGTDDIVGWEVHGRCFKIHDLQQFVDKILPRFFRMKKYASFQRQLNLYMFRRITIGSDRGAYYHEMFVRGRPGLAFRMKRTKYKGNGPRKPASPQSEPNFYHMPPVGDGNNAPMPSQQSQQQQQQLNMQPLERQPSLAYFQNLPPPPPLSGHDDSLPGTTTSSALSRTSSESLKGSQQPGHSTGAGHNISSFLDELLRQSISGGTMTNGNSFASSSTTGGSNNETNLGHLNLAAFLAGQHRNTSDSSNSGIFSQYQQGQQQQLQQQGYHTVF